MALELPYEEPAPPDLARTINRERAIARLTSNPAANFLFRVCDKITSYRAIRDRVASVDRLQRTLDAGATSFADTGYSAANDDELQVAINYRNEIESGFANSAAHVRGMYERQQDLLGELIESRGADRVVNFGVSYGYIDDRLARRFGGVTFFGVDRSTATKKYNEAIFGQRNNLLFEADDILSFLQRTRAQSGILFHARTATFISKPLVAEVYAAARRAGYTCIVGFEPFGISRATNAPLTFDLNDRPSVAYVNGMIIHNYPRLLADAGYQLASADVIRAAQPGHPDHRILEFVGVSQAN